MVLRHLVVTIAAGGDCITDLSVLRRIGNTLRTCRLERHGLVYGSEACTRRRHLNGTLPHAALGHLLRGGETGSGDVFSLIMKI